MNIEWTDELKVGVEFMDADHKEAVDMMSEMQTAEAESLRALLVKFTDHCRDHFARENQLMERIGFFAQGCHEDEHQRVLAELEDMAGKDDTTLQAYARDDLPEWFIGHRNSMDFVTAQFAQQMGEN